MWALAAAVFGLAVLVVPAQAQPILLATPTGCTTSIEWVNEGNNSYFQGRGNVQCATGRYKAKALCHNLQSGERYVKYGTLAVNAPSTATVTCNSGNTAESVHAVEDPPAVGIAGCTSWVEWIYEGNNTSYRGHGIIQCDTGRYKAKAVCRNNQTGAAYVRYGTMVVNAPSTTTVNCYSGNTAESVHAVQDPPAAGFAGCASWAELVVGSSSYYYGRGVVQCDTGRYKAKAVCRNNQTGEGYVKYGGTVTSAPGETTVTCNSGNTAESVHAVQDPPAAGVTGCASWIEWVHEGSSSYYGRGNVQCDTGRYQASVTCKNLQSGEVYVRTGTVVATAPYKATITCYSGNVAQFVQVVPQ